MDFLFEFLFELFFEAYIELMMYIVPKEKATLKRYRVIAIIIATISLLGNLALFIWGGILLFGRHNFWGLVPIAVAICFSLAQIFIGFILNQKKNK